MRLGRLSIALGAVLAGVLVPAGTAAAALIAQASLTMPASVTVGQTGQTGSISLFNFNTPPQHTESIRVTEIRLVLSCGTGVSPASICIMPDPGVFAIDSPATGRVGTICEGRLFTVSAPDADGAVSVTVQGAPVVIPPPGAPPSECTVDFTFSVVKAPVLDPSPPVPGARTQANLRVTFQSSITGAVVVRQHSVQLTVDRATPALATQATLDGPAGTMSDVATVTGEPVAVVPSGDVTFSVYGPDDDTCAAAVGSSTNALAGGTATSDAFPVGAPGTYRFIASYSGDTNYLPVTAPCDAPNESVVVPVGHVVADFDGSGTTDRSVYRDGAWHVDGQEVVYFGLAGDIPVPGDYDGNGTTDRAVYRDGAWYVDSQDVAYFGLPGDVPVPGDYDGDGDADRAVFRPSVGAWYVDGLDPVFLGQADDVPVPGDYDGNATTDRAVFRAGAWYTDGQATGFLGQADDIPVPGDYDGNATTDRAVFRGGTWYVDGQATGYLGLTGDMPMPGDYDGDGTTDRGVYRNGAWYVEDQATAYLGLPSDIPLPLPQAIYARFF